jgi:hypothetical protein
MGWREEHRGVFPRVIATSCTLDDFFWRCGWSLTLDNVPDFV